MTNKIIFGGSRGLGGALASGLPQTGDTVWLVSRKEPPHLARTGTEVDYRWVQADLAEPSAADTIASAVGDSHLDLLLYNAGIWESTAFSKDYDFETLDPSENRRVLTVNLTAAVDCVQKLLPNVRQAQHGKIIVIGSTSALHNISAPEIAYTASKFGILGMVHALREITRPDEIGVTCINPGYMTNEIPLEKEAEHFDFENPEGDKGMPLSDIVKVVQMILSLSPNACVKEINIPAMSDTDA